MAHGIRCLTILYAALMALVGLSSLVADDATPSTETPVTRLTRTAFPKFFVAYTPDGSRLVYTRHHENRRASGRVLMGLRSVALDGTGDRPLLSPFDAAVQIQEHAAFSPDGQTLLVTGGGSDTGNAAKDVFVATFSTDGEAGDLRKVVPGAGVGVGEQPSWSPDGREFVVTTTQKALWIFSADGKTKRRLVQPGGQYCFQPAWSPAGDRIAFASDRDGNSEIYTIRRDGSDLQQLTREPGVDCRPRWSRDGAWLVFTSNRRGREDLYLMRGDGTDLRPLTDHPAVDDHAAWSPDGRHIAFVSLRDGGFDLYRIDVPADLAIGPAPSPVPLVAVNVPSAKRPAAAAKTDAAGGLVAHFTFDEEPVAANKAKTTRDGAGKTRFDLDGARVDGKAGRGTLSFGGDPAFATVAPLDPFHLSGALTISVWVRPDTLGANGYVLSKHGWNIYIGTDLIPRFETRNAADNAWDTLAATAALPRGKWSHIAAVFDPAAERLKLYLDGRLSAEQPRTDGKLGAAESYPLELGRYNAGKSQYFVGELDSLRVYDRALAADAVLKLHDTEKPVVGADATQ